MNKKLLPLAILDLADEKSVEGITRFQKLVFLAQEEELNKELYPFIAGSYGPYSKPLYDDIDRLVNEGFIQEDTEATGVNTDEDKQVYKLKRKGELALKQSMNEYADDLSQEGLKELVDKYRSMGLWNLLEYVYEEYPEMAKNSKLHI